MWQHSYVAASEALGGLFSPQKASFLQLPNRCLMSSRFLNSHEREENLHMLHG